MMCKFLIYILNILHVNILHNSLIQKIQPETRFLSDWKFPPIGYFVLVMCFCDINCYVLTRAVTNAYVFFEYEQNICITDLIGILCFVSSYL